MKITVTAITKEINGKTSGDLRKKINKAINGLRLYTSKRKAKELFQPIITGFKIFSGKQAAICYAEDNYTDARIQNDEKALKRFEQIIPTLHHSIADHVNITLLIEGIPKILAMLLNSLGQYATSEKSGRYTKMKGRSKKEKQAYEKWLEIFKNLIEKEYPAIDEKTRMKLSMENARYMLSVFTPTTMSYTTSLRQYNYIIDWLDRFCMNVSDKSGLFAKKLVSPMKELRDAIEFLYVDGLRDMKNRSFSFLANETNSPSVDAKENFGGETYTVRYNSSFAALAQAQRHRTLSYKMCLNENPTTLDDAFYIPPILFENEYAKNMGLAKMWLEDLSSMWTLFPQATLVNVIESGEVEKFFLKCQERICGRAQLEIARQTRDTYYKIAANADNYGESLKALIQSFEITAGSEKRIKAKCECLSCKEPCRWGAKNAITRKI